MRIGTQLTTIFVIVLATSQVRASTLCATHFENIVTSERLNNGNTLLQLNPKIVNERMQPYGRGKQRNTHWCWAACLQMTLNFYGINETQESIVEKAYGAVENLSGSQSTMDESLAKIRLISPNKTVMSYQTQDVALTSEAIIATIRSGKPLVLALQESPTQSIGHAYLVVGVIMNESGEILQLKTINSRTRSDGFAFIQWSQVHAQFFWLVTFQLQSFGRPVGP